MVPWVDPVDPDCLYPPPLPTSPLPFALRSPSYPLTHSRLYSWFPTYMNLGRTSGSISQAFIEYAMTWGNGGTYLQAIGSLWYV
jgi:hypothetical protein